MGWYLSVTSRIVKKVAEALAHLLRVHLHEAVVHPVLDEGLRAVVRPAPARRRGLREFVLVVREDEILPAAVNVDGRAQHLLNHRRTLDVPPGSTRAPRRIPRRLPGLRSLPQREIRRILLPIVHRHALARAVILQFAAAQRTVPGQRVHREVHVAVPGGVRVSLRDQTLGHLHDVADVFRRAGFHRRRKEPRGRHVFVKSVDESIHERLARLAIFVCARDDLIVDVGEVAAIRHVVALAHELAVEHVEGDVHARVADVAVVVDGNAAHVHGNLTVVASRHEGLLLARHGVVQDHARGCLAGNGIRARGLGDGARGGGEPSPDAAEADGTGTARGWKRGEGGRGV